MGDGFLSKLKVLIGIEEVDDDEYEDEEEIDRSYDRKSLEHRGAGSYARLEAPENRAHQEGRIVSMQGRGGASQSGNHFKMVVIEPRGFEECPKLVDNLKDKKPVIINLEKMETDTARKIFDFLSGATYALGGNVQKVANNIFIFAPENVDVTVPIDTKGLNLGDKWR
ncbi:MAG: cell division protein SepF [Anaerovoracaceae bacterium]|jgi:cell division inhibitor SepF